MSGPELLCIDVLGTPFVVRWGRSVTGEQQERMLQAWSRCLSGLMAAPPELPPVPAEPTESQPFSASVSYPSNEYDGGTLHVQSASFEGLAEKLSQWVTAAAIQENAGEFILLHACGAAALDTGGVVALVGKAGSGKTIAAAVLADVYGYVTDETVAILPDSSVVPYPKPLQVRQVIPGSPTVQVGPDQLGLLPAPRKPFIQSIVLLDRVDAEPGTAPAPVLQRVPTVEAVLALIADSSSQAEVDQPLQTMCRLIDSVGGVWQVTYSEAAELPQVLEPLFRKRTRSRPGWVAPHLGTDFGPIPAGSVRRVVPTDAVAVDGDMLLMLGSEVVRLGGIAPALWEAAARAVSLEELAGAVGAVHGTPDGYRAAVAAAVEELIAKSILERGGSTL